MSIAFSPRPSPPKSVTCQIAPYLFELNCRKEADGVRSLRIEKCLFFWCTQSRACGYMDPYTGIVYDLGIEDPRELPDGKKMGILKRIDWLCQYIDPKIRNYHPIHD